MQMNKLEQTIIQIQEIEIMIAVLLASPLKKFEILRKTPYDTIRRISSMYWKFDYPDLLAIRTSLYKEFAEMVDISELIALTNR